MPDKPRQIIVDSGPLIALFDADDAHHARALDFVQSTSAPLVSTMAAITEVMYVLDESLPAKQNLLAWIHQGGLSLVEPGVADFARIAELLAKYSDLPMDFTDAVIVALCERLDILHVATVDRDFTIYRFRGRTRFINAFFA